MSMFGPNEALGVLRDDPAEFGWTVAEDAPRLERSTERRGLTWYRILTALVVIALASRLFFLQVAQGGSHQLLAQGNRIRNAQVEPPRGIILDRHGELLAQNTPAFALDLTPAHLPKDREEREPIYELAASLSDKTIEEVRMLVSDQGLRSLTPVTLREHLDHETAILYKVKIGATPGLQVVDRPVRSYTQAPGLAHLLGYTGKISPDELDDSADYSLSSITGKTGVEATYQRLLHGTPGVEQLEVDSRGYLQRVVGQQAAVPGDTVVLSVDVALQRKLGEVLTSELEKLGSPAGVGIIMDPRDGSLRALVSLPDYNNNEFATGISSERYQELVDDERKLFSNRAIAGQYPSGSVIKPVVAAGGLADGVITEETSFDAPGEIRIGEFVFPDWKRHGVVDVKRAIAVSSNVFFYAVGGGYEQIRGLGIDRLNHYFELFGFGRATGIDLPGESIGLVPTPEWKKRVKGEPWYLGDTYHAAIGQGDFLVTPLQLANATATIANGGTIQTPHLLWKDQPVKEGSGIGPPGARGSVNLDGYQLGVVRAGMRQAVESGSARRLQSVPIPMAGKTGTAQFGTEDKTHAWFTGFAPYENPELVITILIEGGGGGADIAVPVAEEVLKWHYTRPTEERE